MKFIRQQGFDTRSLQQHGCGLATGINAMIAASGGKWRPGDDGTAFAKVLKARSGVTDAEFNARGVTSRELFTALGATADDNPEWMPLGIKAYHGGLMTEMLDKMEEVGGVLLVAIRNKVLAKAGKSPFPGFNGGHWGVVVGRTGSGLADWVDAGRTTLIKLPVGLLTEAAGQFGDKRDVGLSDDSWGDGRGEAILVYPWLTWEAGYSRMKKREAIAIQQRDKARKDLAEAQTALLECQAQPPNADLATLRTKVKNVAGRMEALVDELDVAVAPI
jgi:hypothetical protein